MFAIWLQGSHDDCKQVLLNTQGMLGSREVRGSGSGKRRPHLTLAMPMQNWFQARGNSLPQSHIAIGAGTIEELALVQLGTVGEGPLTIFSVV